MNRVAAGGSRGIWNLTGSFLLLMPAATALLAAAAEAGELPGSIVMDAPDLHPECVEWDPERHRFLVSSVTRGTVSTVSDDGSLTELVNDPDIIASIGIHVDHRHGRVLVASSDPAVFEGDVKGQARLGIYDLSSGQRRHMVDLGTLHPEGRHFANDVTVDPDGNAYVTNSFSPVIYRVAADGEASVFLEDARLGAERLGLNGIDYHPGGFLLVAVAGDRALYKVPLDAPAEMSKVALSEPFGADGLFLREGGALVAVAVTGSGEDRRMETLLLESDDDWRTASIAARAPTPGATTAVVRNGATYVVDPRFADMGGEDPVSPFEIRRVHFER